MLITTAFQFGVLSDDLNDVVCIDHFLNEIFIEPQGESPLRQFGFNDLTD